MKTIPEYEYSTGHKQALFLIPTLRLWWHRNRLRNEGRPNPQLEKLFTDEYDIDDVFQTIFCYYPSEFSESYCDEEDETDVAHDFYSNERLQKYYRLCNVYSMLCGSTLTESPYYRKLCQYTDRHLGCGSWGVRLADNVSYPCVEILYYCEQSLVYEDILAGLLDLDYFLEKAEKPLIRAVKKKKRTERRKKVRTNAR